MPRHESSFVGKCSIHTIEGCEGENAVSLISSVGDEQRLEEQAKLSVFALHMGSGDL